MAESSVINVEWETNWSYRQADVKIGIVRNQLDIRELSDLVGAHGPRVYEDTIGLALHIHEALMQFAGADYAASKADVLHDTLNLLFQGNEPTTGMDRMAFAAPSPGREDKKHVAILRACHRLVNEKDQGHSSDGGGGEGARGHREDDTRAHEHLRELYNYIDGRGATALFMAAQYRLPAVIEALAAHGANVNFHDNQDVTPLTVAIMGSHEAAIDASSAPRLLETVQTLLRLGAHPDVVDPNGATPLVVACRLGVAPAAACLLDAGADIEFRVKTGRIFATFTPLMVAATHNHAGIVNLLLQRGADPAKRTTETNGAYEDFGLGDASTPVTYNVDGSNSSPGRLPPPNTTASPLAPGYMAVAGAQRSGGEMVGAVPVGSTALDISRARANCVLVLAVLRRKCCSGCGKTRSETSSDGKLKLCEKCSGKGARYCSLACQKSDWARHKKECGDC